MSINLESLSITSIFNSIVSYFQSADNKTRFKDLTNSSEGSFLIRMLSNVFSTLSYRIVAQSRENYLETAALTSSNIGISQNLGYSVFRGTNMRRLVKVTPNETYVYPRLSTIGQYSDEYDIICLDETSLENGVSTDIRVTVGKVKQITITPGTSDVKPFVQFTTGISEDYKLELDSVEVPTTDKVKEMVYDKYLVQTNPYSSVNVMYLNNYSNFQYKYGSDSELVLSYVELADVDVSAFTSSMFNIGVMTDYKTISLYQPFESVDNMKVNGPIQHEVQNLIRSKADYAKRLQEEIPAIIDSNFKALTPTYTLITYLKDDLTLLTSSEKESFLDVVEEENFFGTPLPDITVPRREVANLQISMALKNKYKNISEIELDISNILQNYYNPVLNLTFNVYDFERRLEDLSYVRYARVAHVVNTRVPGATYQIGYILEKDSNYYIASQILGTSGSIVPNWNIPLKIPTAIDTGLETTDGGIVWRCYKYLPSMEDSVSLWQRGAHYGLGEYVYTDRYLTASGAPRYMFKCVDLIKSSGNTMPDITYASEGDFITDGGLVWVVKSRVDADNWVSLTNYRLGDSVNSSTSSTLSLECVSYTGTTDTTATADFEFELPSYEVVGETYNSFSIAGDKTFYLRAGDIISATHSGGYTKFTIKASEYSADTDYTTITVDPTVDTTITYLTILTEERGTRDGQILWNLIDDVTEITYPWQNYTTFSYSLDIIGS